MNDWDNQNPNVKVQMAEMQRVIKFNLDMYERDNRL
jgi:hypothetical protein